MKISDLAASSSAQSTMRNYLHSRSISARYRILFIWFSCVCIAQAWGRRNHLGRAGESLSKNDEEISQDEADNLEAVPYLVHQLGHQVSFPTRISLSSRFYDRSFTWYCSRNDPLEYVDTLEAARSYQHFSFEQFPVLHLHGVWFYSQ